MIFSRVVIDIETNLVIEREILDYTGPIALCKGASQTEQNLSNDQNNFFNTLRSNYNQQFAGQSAILSSLTSAFSPILSAGPGQYGYTPQEDAALRTQSDTGTAQGYQSAKAAAGEALAAQGGGNTFLPSSTKAGITSNIATNFAQQRAGQQLGITQSGYDVGRQNFYNAANALSGTAQIMNPVGYSNSANTAGTNAFGSANTINQQDQAAQQQMWSLIGGAAGSFLGPIGGALGSSLGSSLSGGGSPLETPGITPTPNAFGFTEAV